MKKLFLLAATLFVAAITYTLNAQTENIVTTIAGNGTTGYSGNGGPAKPQGPCYRHILYTRVQCRAKVYGYCQSGGAVSLMEAINPLPHSVL